MRSGKMLERIIFNALSFPARSTILSLPSTPARTS
jgi:hypothetical protein